MRKHAFAIAAGIGVLVVGSALALGAEGRNAFGKTLGEWMELDALWRLGADQENPEGKMVFLPNINDVPDEDIGVAYDEDADVLSIFGAMDVALEPGQKFSMPLINFFGEAYVDGSEDDPDPDLWRGMLEAFHIRVWLDGTLIVDSEDDDYGDHWYGPQVFEEMVAYDEVNERDAVGVIWVEGFGLVHGPLSRGEHTLVWNLFAEGYGAQLGYDWGSLENELTLNITVDR